MDEEGREFARECQCGIRRRMMYDNKIRFADFPCVFKDVCLDNFKKSVYQLPDSREKAVRYWLGNLNNMKNRGIGLYLYSATKGSGKTRLAASIANELIRKYDTQVKFTTSINILDEIKRTWETAGHDKTDFSNGPTENRLIDFLITTEILIIDDFGVEQPKGWINDRFYSIINGRYLDKKITIFTSNARLDDLHYDERITSRIKERVLQIPFPEESVRDHLAGQLKSELLNGIK